MTRFIAHRTFNPKSSCSRPVDFFALLAAMTLLLVHLDAHHRRGNMATNFLAHQRLSDRAMLDQAIDRLDMISHLSKDATAQQSAALIRRLLDLEADAARGNRDPARSESVSAGVPGSNNAATETGSEHDLLLPSPYLNLLWNTREGPIARELWLEGAAVSLPHAPPPIDAQSYTTSQNPSTLPTNTPASDCSIQSRYDDPSMLHYSTSSADNMTLQHPMGLSTRAGVNDWTFEGVDMAFFDSLMRGTSCMDPAELEHYRTA